MTEPNILDKVRKLLAKAEATDNPHEAEAFSAKATALAAEYALDAALIQAPAVTSGLLKPTTKVITISAPYTKAKGDILTAIAFAHNCQVLFRGTRYTLVGFESDLELVEILYASLVVQALAAVAGKRPDSTNQWHRNTPAPGETKSFRNAFLVGFAHEVHRRFARIKDHGREAGTDLVLADRGAAVQEKVEELYPKAKTEKRQVRSTGGGYGQGRTAGSKADLGQSRVGGRSAPALSR